MKPIQIDWALVQAQCIRIGWGAGWTAGIAIAMVGWAAGAVPELTALRAFLALIAFVLLGWGTGLVLSHFAPEDSEEELLDLGSKVDLTIGDEDEPNLDGMESVEPEGMAEPQEMAQPEEPAETSNAA